MENKPLVSVVIASYNMATYLPLAVESALAQTYEHIEVLVIDDGSTDDTRKVMERFLDNSRVKYFFQENSGQAVAKNRGIRESRGEYIAFLDADDMWTTKKLELQLPAFTNAEKVGVVYGKIMAIDEASREIGGPYGQCYNGRVTTKLFHENIVPFLTAIVRRRCFEEIGLFNEQYKMGVDWDLWLRISTRYEFRFVDEVVGLYRIWGQQISNNWKGRYEHCFLIRQNFLDSYPELLPKEEIKTAWSMTYINRGRVRSAANGEHIQALLDVARAIGCMPFFLPAWRAIGRILLNAFNYRECLGKST